MDERVVGGKIVKITERGVICDEGDANQREKLRAQRIRNAEGRGRPSERTSCREDEGKGRTIWLCATPLELFTFSTFGTAPVRPEVRTALRRSEGRGGRCIGQECLPSSVPAPEAFTDRSGLLKLQLHPHASIKVTVSVWHSEMSESEGETDERAG